MRPGRSIGSAVVRPALVLPLAIGIGIAAARPEAAPTVFTLAGRIPLKTVQGRIDHMAVDAAGHRLFVAAMGNDSVEIIDVSDVSSARVTGEIRHLQHPQGLAFLAGRNVLVVASAGDPIVRFYDLASRRVVRDIRLGNNCDNVRVDLAAARVYVGYGDGAIAAIDFDGRKVWDVGVGAHPESFQLEPGGTRIFVNVPTNQEIVVIDRSARTIVARWPLSGASANFPMAYDSDHERLFVGCRRPARLLALDARTGAKTAELDTIGDTDDLFYDVAADRVYVIGGAGAIAIVSASGGLHELERIETSAGARTGLWVPDLKQMFIAAPRRGNVPAEIMIYQLAASF